MRSPTRGMSLRFLIACVVVAAIWSFIVVQGLVFQRRHPTVDRMWGQP